jgi:micrococcal nuclease
MSLKKDVYAQGLKHHIVDKAETEKDFEAAPKKIADIDSAITSAIHLDPKTDLTSLKLIKTIQFKTVIDAQTILTDEGEIVYLEALYIPKDNENDLTTKAFLEENFLDMPINLYGCKDSKCKDKDRYGHRRVHAVTKADNLWVQGALLASGYAQIRTRNDWPFLIDHMRQIERMARAQEIGLWQDQNLLPKDALDIAESLRGFFMVEGTVRSVAMNNNRIYLNFGQDWREDFTVIVPSNLRRAFSKQNIDIMDAGGKALRVRGWIDGYNGPFIDVDHPEQIEWLEQDVPTADQ